MRNNLKKSFYFLVVFMTISGCSINEEQLLEVVDHNKTGKKVKNTDKSSDPHYIHIIKNIDDTKIEFWINPFEDDVVLDYQFSQPVMKDVFYNNATNSLHETNNSKAASNKISSYSIEDYLFHYENAQALYYAKKYTKSLISVKKAIAFNPDVAQGYKLQGTILYTLKRYDEALDAWKKALSLNPKLNDVKKSIKLIESN